MGLLLGFSPRPHRALLLPLLLLPLLFLSFPSLTSSTPGPTSGANCTLTFPPLSPASLYGNATQRLVYLQARDATGTAVTSGGDLFSASLFSSFPSCDTNLTYPHCAVTCSPLSSPYTPSPSCLSSPYPPSTSFTLLSPNYVPISITDLGAGLYSLPYLPSHPDLYSLSVALLTPGGLRASYYDNVWFLPPASLQRIDPSVSLQLVHGRHHPHRRRLRQRPLAGQATPHHH